MTKWTVQIPVYRPHFSGKEREYVLDCLDSGWISSKGDYISKFETCCANYIGTDYASAVSNGTVALHLALLLVGIGPGDEVIVPTLTYVASVNAILYVGATPVFCDCDAETWQIDVEDAARRVTARTKALMVIHLYGQPAPMEAVMRLAKTHGLKVVEDAAEALGSRIGDRHVGTYGDVSTFSFFGNKTLTTGEGGLVATNNQKLHSEITLLKSQYVSPERRYWHDKVGYNYRMTNVAAAIGVGQFADLNWVIERKRKIARSYKDNLKDIGLTHHAEVPGTTHNFWMCSILVEHAEMRDVLMQRLEREGIETRPIFYPAHLMPPYAPFAKGENFERSQSIASRGINLPSFPDLTDAEVETICTKIKRFLVTG